MSTTVHWEAVAERIEQVREIARAFAERARDHFGGRLRDIRLFGSAARGDWQEDSDIDVLLLLDRVAEADRDWISTTAGRVGVLDTGLVLSTVTLAEEQFRKLQQRERLFALEVERDGIGL